LPATHSWCSRQNATTPLRQRRSGTCDIATGHAKPAPAPLTFLPAHGITFASPSTGGANMTHAPEISEENLLQVALRDVSTHALILLDAKGVVVGWLAGAERLFGYKADEIVGKNASLLFTPEDLNTDLSVWERNT